MDKYTKYIVSPVDGTSLKNSGGAVSQHLSKNYGVKGYVAQEKTPYVFHVADVARCLMKDRLKTLQWLDHDDKSFGFDTTKWRHAASSKSRQYFDGESKLNQPRSERLKDALLRLFSPTCAAVEHDEIVSSFGSIWNEHLSHDHYVTLESKIFETLHSLTDTDTQTSTDHPTQTLSHTHDDGTICITPTQYETLKTLDLLHLFPQEPQIVMQRAASR